MIYVSIWVIYVSVSSGMWLLEVRGVVLQFRPLEIWALYKGLSYDPGNRAGSVTGMNFVVCSCGKFQPGYRDEIQETKPKWRNINKYCSRLS